MLTNINTKIDKPEVTQELLDDEKRRQENPDLKPALVFNYSELLYSVANEEGWGNDLPTRKQIEVFGVMFDEFFHLYFLLYPSNTRQQAKDCALELTKVMKDMAKDHKEFTFALFANYWYSRKEV